VNYNQFSDEFYSVVFYCANNNKMHMLIVSVYCVTGLGWIGLDLNGLVSNSAFLTQTATLIFYSEII